MVLVGQGCAGVMDSFSGDEMGSIWVSMPGSGRVAFVTWACILWPLLFTAGPLTNGKGTWRKGGRCCVNTTYTRSVCLPGAVEVPSAADKNPRFVKPTGTEEAPTDRSLIQLRSMARTRIGAWNRRHRIDILHSLLKHSSSS